MLANFRQRLAILDSQINTPEGRLSLLESSIDERASVAKSLLDRYVISVDEKEKKWIKLVLIGAIGSLDRLDIEKFYSEIQFNISIIVACDENGCIGNGNSIPWHFAEDMKWFKETTVGHPVIMGRKTFDSIGKPLPRRFNIVLSREMRADSNELCFVSTLKDAVAKASEISSSCFVIGGAQIYKMFIESSIVSKIYLTKIPGKYSGDTVVPFWPLENYGWNPVEQVIRPTLNGLEFWIYSKKII